MERVLTGCLCAGLWWWAAFSSHAAPDKDQGLIIAGERIGQVQINKVDPDLSALGEPSDSDASMGGKGTETWFSKSPDGLDQELTIYTVPTEANRKHYKTVWVYVTSPFFHTSAGVSTRSDPAAIWQEFPDLQYQSRDYPEDTKRMDYYVSAANGIGFLIERDEHPAAGKPWGRCRAIMVFERGGDIDAAPMPRVQAKP